MAELEVGVGGVGGEGDGLAVGLFGGWEVAGFFESVAELGPDGGLVGVVLEDGTVGCGGFGPAALVAEGVGGGGVVRIAPGPGQGKTSDFFYLTITAIPIFRPSSL